MQATFLIYNIAIFFYFSNYFSSKLTDFFSKPQILVNQFTKNHKKCPFHYRRDVDVFFKETTNEWFLCQRGKIILENFLSGL